MRPSNRWSIAAVLVGLLLMAGVSAGLDWVPCPRVLDGSMICVRMVMTPQIPSLGETAEVIAGVNSQYVDIPKAEIYFGNPEGKQTGVELVGCPAKYTASLEKGVWKEFRFKIKFVGSSAHVFVDVLALEVRREDGSIGKTPPEPGWREGAGYDLVMHEKTKKFYMDLPKEDPEADFQKELGLPEGSYGYSIALHLRHDMVAFAKAKGIPFEEAVRLLKARAERLAREKKLGKLKAYEEVLTKRLMWKEAGLPDPSTKPPEDKGQGFLKTPRLLGVDTMNTQVNGYWYYDDHKYTRTQGLLTSSGYDTVTPVRHCKVVLSDFGSNQHPETTEVFDDSTVTANTGNFQLIGHFLYAGEYYHVKLRLKAEGGQYATSIKLQVVDTSGNVWYFDKLDSVFIWGCGGF